MSASLMSYIHNMDAAQPTLGPLFDLGQLLRTEFAQRPGEAFAAGSPGGDARALNDGEDTHP
jgi:hypothetical protein